MRASVFLTFLLCACSSGVEPTTPLVTIRQERAAAPGLVDRAEVRGNLIFVQGHFTLRGGCRALRGTLQQAPGVLTLDVLAGPPPRLCPEEWSEYDYKATIGPVPSGTYEFNVTNRGTDQPLGLIVLKTELRVD
jgi:hypothetical protein